MAGVNRPVLLAAAELLTYPDVRLRERLPEIEQELRKLSGREGRDLAGLVRHLSESELLTLQEEYVSTFDLAGGVVLFLTYPRYQDDRARGEALVALRQRYRTAGWDPDPRVLPDYLPMVLEFLGLAEPDESRPVAQEYLAPLRGIAERLRARSSPYYPVVEACARAVTSLSREPFRGEPAA